MFFDIEKWRFLLEDKAMFFIPHGLNIRNLNIVKGEGEEHYDQNYNENFIICSFQGGIL